MSGLGIDVGGTRVKAAVLDDAGAARWTGCSGVYQKPTFEALRAAVGELLAGAPPGWASGGDLIGVCVPGVRDAETGIVTAATNLPSLVGRHPAELLGGVVGAGGGSRVRVVSDALAATVDVVVSQGLGGRVLGVSLGTGVGAAVIDEPMKPLRVSGGTPGHFGHVDVTLGEDEGAAPVGGDGASGTLEAYIGLPALMRAWGVEWTDGEAVSARLGAMGVEDAPVRALVRALRIAHAVYRPDHIRLLGGVGLALGPKAGAILERVSDRLTSLARAGWTLAAGETAFHAAIGAARCARLGIE